MRTYWGMWGAHLTYCCVEFYLTKKFDAEFLRPQLRTSRRYF